MKRIATAAVVIAALLTAVGCSSPKTTSTPATGSTPASGSPAASAQPAGSLGSFPKVKPDSANEKTVASKYDAYFASYEKFSQPNATAANRLYAPKAGEKPQFIGYAVTAYSPKDAKGLYGALQVVVTGDHVQMFGSSQFAADLEYGQNKFSDGVLTFRSSYDAQQSDPKLTPASAGEKNAVEVASAWVEKNLGTLGYAPGDVALTGYVLFWGGKPDADKSLYLLVQPGSDLVQASWRG
jgi:hypothetical protein